MAAQRISRGSTTSPPIGFSPGIVAGDDMEMRAYRTVPAGGAYAARPSLFRAFSDKASEAEQGEQKQTPRSRNRTGGSIRYAI